MFSQESINSEKLIDFMERLIKDSGHKIYLILDNLASDSEYVKSYFEHPKLDDYDEI